MCVSGAGPKALYKTNRIGRCGTVLIGVPIHTIVCPVVGIQQWEIMFSMQQCFTTAFFEKLFKPCIEKLNLSDERIGSKYMVMSIKAQINSLKIVMNRDYLVFINVTLYKK